MQHIGIIADWIITDVQIAFVLIRQITPVRTEHTEGNKGNNTSGETAQKGTVSHAASAAHMIQLPLPVPLLTHVSSLVID